MNWGPSLIVSQSASNVCAQGRFMAVDFSSDMQAELNYFAGPGGLGADGVYTDCTRTTSEWLAIMCVGACRTSAPCLHAAVKAWCAALPAMVCRPRRWSGTGQPWH